jgi:hypothetical protein
VRKSFDAPFNSKDQSFERKIRFKRGDTGLLVFHFIHVAMSRSKVYKKHIKQATDLFWTPKDGGTGSGLHWKFDEQYSVVTCDTFPVEQSQDVIADAFWCRNRPELPIPRFTSDTDCDLNERQLSGRAFLAFLDGFWADLRSSEHQPLSIF